MEEKKCKYCAMMIPEEASICPHCRKPQGWTMAAKIFVGLATLIFIGILGNALKSPLTPPTQTVAKKEPSEQFKKMTSREHLDAAKAALANGYKPNRDIRKTKWGGVAAAKDNLNAISAGSSEYPEAQNLMKEVNRRENEINKLALIIANEILTKQRKEFADKYEISLLDQGMDTKVSVSGKNNTILKIKWVLMSRPLVYKLINNSETMANLKKMGFEKLILTDGYDSAWSIDLSK